MKATILVLLGLTFALGAQAQSMEARRAKQEMIDRAQLLQTTAEQGQELFEQQKVKEGCAKVGVIFQSAPSHLTGIMNRMDMSKKKIRKMQNEALEMLRSIHSMDFTCKEGKDQEKVDPDLFAKRLKNFAKAVKRHRHLIEDQDTDWNNEYYYSYEF